MSHLAEADVISWDDGQVKVRCPFCDKVHHHGPGPSRYSRQTRMAHCDTSSYLDGNYLLVYPFDARTGRIAYEIDKARRRFLTVGVEQDEDLDINSLVSSLEDRLNIADRDTAPVPSLDEGTEEKEYCIERDNGEVIRWMMKTLDLAISNCICGRTAAVERFIAESPDANILVSGEDRHGNTALIMASAEMHPAMVYLLLDHGAPVDRPNKEGRTPLMEAALWGRAENVRNLLQRGADKNLRDSHRLQAIDFAKENNRNSEERYWRSGGKHQVYKENTFVANMERREIVRILSDCTTSSVVTTLLSTTAPQNYACHSFHNMNRESTIVLSAPIARFPVPRMKKTIARLERGFPFPTIDAMSGWGHPRSETIGIAGREWTDQVFAISSLIGHSLEPDVENDHGRPGQFHACHAEKQLIAYFIDKHFFLLDERFSGLDSDETLHPLFDSRPPVELKKAIILVSRPVCGDCWAFVRQVKSIFDLDFEIISC